MAITINSTPSLYTLSGNDVLFDVTSNNYAQENFKYVVDIYNGSTLITRIKVNRNYPNTNAVINVGRILQSYVEANIIMWVPFETEIPKITTTGIYAFSIEFGEEYGSTPVIYSNLQNSGTKYIISGSLDQVDFYNFDYSDYALTDSSSKFLFLSNYGRSSNNPIIVRENEWHTLSYLALTSNRAYKLNMVSTDSYGGITTNTFSPLSYPGISSNIRKIQTIPTGWNLNYIDGFAGITQPIISTNTVSYTIQILDNTGTARSEMIYYALDKNCSKDDVYSFHYLNSLGGWDTICFSGAQNPFIEISRKSYKGDPTASNNFRADIDFLIKKNGRISLQTDWITDVQAVYFEDFFTSPMIYRVVDPDLDIIEFWRVFDSSYKVERSVNNKLFNIKVDMAPARSHYKQIL